MADEGISYEWTVNAKLEGVEAGTHKLEAAAAATSKLDGATLKLGGAAHGASEHLKGAHEALDKVTHGHEKATQAAHGHAEGFKGVGHSIAEAKERMHSFMEYTGAFLVVEGIEHIIEKIKEMGSEILNAAAHGERLEKVFEANYGSEEAELMLNYAKQFAKNSEFTTGQIKSYEIELRKAGVALKDLPMALAAAGDLATRSVDKEAGMSGAIYGIARATRTGHIDARSLGRMGVGIPQLREMPEYAGKTDEELRKVLSGGKKTAPFTLGKMYQAIAGKDGIVGDKAVQMVDLMSNKLEKLKQLPDRLYDEFNKSEAFTDLKGKIDHILEVFDPSAPGGKAIVKGIADIGSVIVEMIGKIDFKMLAESIKNDVVPALKHALELVEDMAPVVMAMVHALGSVIEWTTDSGKEADATRNAKAQEDAKLREADIANRMKHAGEGKLMKFMTGGGLWNDDIDDMVEKRIAAQSVRAEKMAAAGKAQGEAHAEGYAMEVIPGMAKASADAAQAGIDAHMSVTETNSPSLVFRRLGRHTAEGYALGINDNASMIDRVMRSMANAEMFPIGHPGGGSRRIGNISLGGIHVTVEGAHKGGHEIGQAVASALKELVPPMLIEALEGMSLEGGTA